MQMQPYSRETKSLPLTEQRGPLAERNGQHDYNDWNGYSNGYASNGQGQHLINPAMQVSYFQVLFQQIKKRGRMLTIWMLIAAAVTAFVVLRFAQPNWKAEGALYYAPNYGYATHRLYTPPNIQTILTLIKAPDLLEKVSKETDVSIGDLQTKLTVNIVKQSDIISVVFESPDKAKSEQVSSRVLELAIEQYDHLRRRLSDQAIVDLDGSLEKARDEELALRKKLNDTLENKKIFNPKTENDSVHHEIRMYETKIIDTEEDQISLQKQIKEMDARLKDLSSASNAQLSDADIGIYNTMREIKTAQQRRQTEIEQAKADLRPLESQHQEWLPLRAKNYVSKQEMEELEGKINKLKVVINGSKDINKFEEALKELEKKILESKGAASIPLQQARWEKLKIEVTLTEMPKKIENYRKHLAERKKQQQYLQIAERDTLPIQQDIESVQLRRNQLATQKQENQKLEENKMGELTIHAVASAGSAPASSNHMKLAAGTFGLSFLLFVGFVALYDMPRALPAAVAAQRAAMPGPPHLPVPVWQHPPQPYTPPVPPQLAPRGPSLNAEQLRSLAERIAPDGVERGKIVLFTPTTRGLRLENLLGDLACVLTKNSGKVLVFEARTDAENPSYPLWTGPSAREVSEQLHAYLEGRSERGNGCFAETLISSIDYARGDLSRRLQSVMAMYRFRRLMNDMRERYSLVLMITPERCRGDDDDVFTTLGEGIVVVINQDANPADVENYLRELRSCETPVYGAFTVPAGQPH